MILNLTLVLFGILFLSIVYLVIRVVRLLYTRPRSRPDGAPAGNTTSAVLMLLFAVGLVGGFWWYFLEAGPQMLPESASVQGADTDRLFYVVLTVILVPFTGLNLLLFYTAFRFRYREGRTAHFYPKNNRLEIVWTLVPTVVFAVLIVLGLRTWTHLKSAAPATAEVIEIMGSQFAWAVRYPGPDNALGHRDYRMIDVDNAFGLDVTDAASFDDLTPQQLHLPKGQPVLLKIFSRDVIHSVFLPHFRVKMDAVPGMTTRFWFTPRYTTAEMRAKTNDPDFDYELACAEVCGRAHFAMRLVVVVEEAEAYARWKSEQSPWLRQHPDYLARVPPDLKPSARLRSGLDTVPAPVSTPFNASR